MCETPLTVQVCSCNEKSRLVALNTQCKVEVKHHNNFRRCIFKRETKYYEWKKPGSSKHDDRIPIYHDSPENRYITPWRERVFPSYSDLIEIDIERYVSLIRNWGYRLYKELKGKT